MRIKEPHHLLAARDQKAWEQCPHLYSWADQKIKVMSTIPLRMECSPRAIILGKMIPSCSVAMWSITIWRKRLSTLSQNSTTSRESQRGSSILRLRHSKLECATE